MAGDGRESDFKERLHLLQAVAHEKTANTVSLLFEPRGWNLSPAAATAVSSSPLI